MISNIPLFTWYVSTYKHFLRLVKTKAEIYYKKNVQIPPPHKLQLTKNDEESSVGGSAVSIFPKLTPKTSNHHYLNE
jgi:hypothetical protein